MLLKAWLVKWGRAITERLGNLSLNPCYVTCYGVILDKSLPVYTTLGLVFTLQKALGQRTCNTYHSAWQLSWMPSKLRYC